MWRVGSRRCCLCQHVDVARVKDETNNKQQSLPLLIVRYNHFLVYIFNYDNLYVLYILCIVERPVSPSLNRFLAGLEIYKYHLDQGPDHGFGPHQFITFSVLIS